MQIFLITLEQMVMLFFFITAGFVFHKLRLVKDNVASVLAGLETFVFLPLLCFNTFAANMTVSNITKKWPIIVVSVAVLLGSYFLSLPLARFFTSEKSKRAIFIYSFTIPNLAYIGFPVISAAFGEEALFDFTIFIISFNVFIYTAGMNMLTNRTKFTFKTLLNPIILSLAAGALFGLSGLTLPSVISNITTTGAACMAPCAMVLMGYVLAKTPLKTMLLNPKMYLAAVIKLIIYPALFGTLVYFICRIFSLDMNYVFLTVVAICLPMGLNSVVFPESVGGDGTLGAQACCVSNLMAIITIPITFILVTVFGFIAA